MRYLLILMFGILSTQGIVYGQSVEGSAYEESNESAPRSPTEVSQEIGAVTERVKAKRFDNKKWKEVVGDNDFIEGGSKKKKKKNKPNKESDDSKVSTGRKRSNAEEDDSTFDDDGAGFGTIDSPILTLIVYASAIGIIGYVLFLVIKNLSIKVNPKTKKTEVQDVAVPIEDIKELEIDRLLREAIAAGNYRLAIRIYFLGLLKQLDEEGFIVWKKDKTNRDYLSELFSQANYFEEVKHLTRSYEEVWYGDHNFSLQAYQQLILSFKNIDQKLKDSKPQ